jgi:hypothetical protein
MTHVESGGKALLAKPGHKQRKYGCEKCGTPVLVQRSEARQHVGPMQTGQPITKVGFTTAGGKTRAIVRAERPCPKQRPAASLALCTTFQVHMQQFTHSATKLREVRQFEVLHRDLQARSGSLKTQDLWTPGHPGSDLYS